MTEITDRYFNDVIARLSGLRDRLAAQMEKAADPLRVDHVAGWRRRKLAF